MTATTAKTLPNETISEAQERRANARKIMRGATDQELDLFHLHMRRMLTDPAYVKATRQAYDTADHARRSSSATAPRRPKIKSETTRRTRPEIEPASARAATMPISEQARAKAPPSPEVKQRIKTKTTWQRVRDAMRKREWNFKPLTLKEGHTAQDAVASLMMPTLVNSLDFKIARHPQTERLAYPDDHSRQLITTKNAKMPWLEMTDAQLPAVIRFALTLCRRAEQENIPLFPQGYFGRTVTINHFYYGDEMSPLQWAVIDQMATRTARLLEVKIEIEPLGHITVSDANL